MNPTFHLKIVSPNEVLYEGEVRSVSSANSVGPFDILREHANFITIVENKPLSIIQADGQKKQFTYSIAIIYAVSNQVRIYTEIQLLQRDQKPSSKV
jgi:F-type H+-transporting ATPase subunit epsilon